MAKSKNPTKQRKSSESGYTRGKHPNSAKNLEGKTFADKPERINKEGRPKLISHLNEELKARGYEPLTDSQLADAYKKLLQLPESELKRISDDKEQPYFIRRVINYMSSTKGMEMLDRIVDRSFGKAHQVLELPQMPFKIDGVTPEQQAMLNDMEKRLKEIDEGTYNPDKEPTQ